MTQLETTIEKTVELPEPATQTQEPTPAEPPKWVSTLRKVQQRILDKPEEFNMDKWFHCICGLGMEIGGRYSFKEFTPQQKNDLFFVWNWPEALHKAYVDAFTTQKYKVAAEVAVERIEQFIAQYSK